MKIFYSSLLISLLYLSCTSKSTNFKKDFQGDWKKEDSEQKAFTVLGDSMYYPALKKGFFYEIEEDTLQIHFTNAVTKSVVLESNSLQMKIIDLGVTRDTLTLVKIMD